MKLRKYLGEGRNPNHKNHYPTSRGFFLEESQKTTSNPSY